MIACAPNIVYRSLSAEKQSHLGGSGDFGNTKLKRRGASRRSSDVNENAINAKCMLGDIRMYHTHASLTITNEVNDNPNLDAGADDASQADKLYQLIIEEFIRQLDDLNKR
jgi:hypothetical protein